ncbi:hypothetical protein RS170_26735 (plasmid) [Escherichia coli]|uniref:hypothetical protein n=1 Tax=Escherichia coli TaxID=562 RepID=UPI0028EDC822|nr:hypothetical protein [Escherichia coli]WNU34943.1 hypothetical protein RS170_26735 [Escherichia coli]
MTLINETVKTVRAVSAVWIKQVPDLLFSYLRLTFSGVFLLLWHCCKVSDEAAFCLIQRPYISKTLLTRRISPRGSP